MAWAKFAVLYVGALLGSVAIAPYSLTSSAARVTCRRRSSASSAGRRPRSTDDKFKAGMMTI